MQAIEKKKRAYFLHEKERFLGNEKDFFNDKQFENIPSLWFTSSLLQKSFDAFDNQRFPCVIV